MKWERQRCEPRAKPHGKRPPGAQLWPKKQTHEREFVIFRGGAFRFLLARGRSRLPDVANAKRDIFAFKSGSAPHINSFELGQHGRYRTNVWQYRGMNTLGPQRRDELVLHPTIKPVALIADAIKDVSSRSGIVLDCFGGSGSTLIAAHKTGRRARLIEIDPLYVDRIIRRWEEYAKDDAVLAATQQPYASVACERGAPTKGTAS